MKIIVTHRYYGCDTGCCGHVVEVDGVERQFEFSHPYGSTPEKIREFITDLVVEKCGAEHVADIDWDHCIVVDD